MLKHCVNYENILISSSSAILPTFSIKKKYGLTFGIIVRDYREISLIESQGKPKKSLEEKIRAILDLKKFKEAYRGADFFIANSFHMKKSLRDRISIQAPIYVIYPPLDSQALISPMAKKERLDCIGFVNKDFKGYNIVQYLAEKFPEIKFYIFGRKPRSELYPENLTFEGWIDNRREMFSTVDAFLVPSQWEEPFGRVAAEALANGLPTLCSNIGGLPEVTSNELFLVTPNKVEEWFERLQWLVNNFDEAANNALNEGRILRSILSIERHNKSVDCMIEEIEKNIVKQATD